MSSKTTRWIRMIMLTPLIAQWFVFVTSEQIALEKHAYQSGTFGVNVASLAVDGNETTCCIACSTCNGYQPSNISGWILIDLGSSYTVLSFTLINSKDPEDRKYMQNFTVSVSPQNTENPDDNVRCFYYNSSNYDVTNISFSCQRPLIGRYVRILRIGGFRFDALSICEVYIYGYSESTTVATTKFSTSSSSTSKTTVSIGISSVKTTSNSTNFMLSSRSQSENETNLSNPSTAEALSTPVLGAIIGVAVGVTVVIIGLIILFVCIKTTQGAQKSSFLSRRQSQKPIMVEDSSSIYAATSCISDSPGRLINKSILSSYVSELRAIPNGFQKEFKKLPDENAGEAKIGQLPDNRLKNRFTNVLPYDNTIVELEVEELDDESSSYVNANFITGYKKTPQMYIAAQGPRPNTIDDFWKMIWQKRVNIIVMITQLIEKTRNKCELYWPEKIDETKCYQNVYVTLVSEEFFADFIDRQFIIHDERREGEMPRTVRQLQYLSWLDNTRPQHCFPLLSFRKRVKTLQMTSTGPLVVHCSSGIGRTGAYIALDYLLDQLAAEGSLSVFACVEEMRRQRMNMVQTQDQYEFIYDALIEEIEFGDTSKSCDTFMRDYSDGEKSKLLPTFERQLEQLRKLSEPKPGRKSAGLDRENLSKNRNSAIVAYDDSRTYLDVSYVSRSDYVNAVSVHSYEAAHAYILTQVPLRDTIVDFWRLIWDYELKTIVLLDDLIESYPRYWSENSGSRTFGPFLVEMTSSQEESQNVWRRQFVLSNRKDRQRESLLVYQFELRNWLKKPQFRSEDVSMLFELRKQLADHLEQQPTPERIVIMCMDGSTKSGLSTAALHVIDRILAETKVDVSLSCRYVRIHRPTSIDSMDHFLFLHEVARMCCRQLIPGEGLGLQLKRLSLSTLYASVRSTSPNSSR